MKSCTLPVCPERSSIRHPACSVLHTAALIALLLFAGYAAAGVDTETNSRDAVDLDETARHARFGEDLMIRSFLPGLAASDDPADQQILANIRWTFLGQADFDDPNEELAPDFPGYGTDAVLLAGNELQNVAHPDGVAMDVGPLKWVAVNLETGFEYLIELPPDALRRVNAAAQIAGLGQGYRGSAPEGVHAEHGNNESSMNGESSPGAGSLDFGANFDLDSGSGEEPGADGWGGGSDSRRRVFNNTTYPYRTMGQLNGGRRSGCSGTLVGPQHVLTAAHCLWSKRRNAWSNVTFRPAREGSCESLACEPYGNENRSDVAGGFSGWWYFTPWQYRQDGSQWKYDYGIMLVRGRPGNRTGWMGYVALGQSATRDYCDKTPFGPGYLGGTCMNRGYPACGFSENSNSGAFGPESCSQGWAYQSNDVCEIGKFHSKGPDGWNSIFTTNCDTGRGHSGSAIYTRNYNGNGNVVLGVVSASDCRTCPERNGYPNRIRRVTPDVIRWINYFRTTQP